MARKETNKTTPGSGAGWLITFSDIMTLLLTFFVLLISMASLTDENKKLVALGSISSTFGIGSKGMDLFSTKESKETPEPGPFEDIKDFAPLKSMLLEDKSRDLHFISNDFIQIFSVSSHLLFEPGESVLKPEGRSFLSTILPAFKNLDYPFLVNGHTSLLRDEYGLDYKQETTDFALDPSWILSLDRTLSVYSYLLNSGIPPEKMRMEAHGRFHPMYTNQTPKGRTANRRVDFILDKRTKSWTRSEFTREDSQEDDTIRYKDFIF